jgi:hypothetical protein
MIKVNRKELLYILEQTPAHQNIMLVGKHGIGKSKIIEQYFMQQGQQVVTLFLGQMSDPGDLIGLPMENEHTGKTDFRPPYWFPTDGKPIVLFLDELNRARPEILQTVMDLTLNKTLAGKHLPEGSRIISAINSGEEYQLTDLDPALVSRFNIYHFVPTVPEWLFWAAENGIDSRVISFIEKHPDCLEHNTEQDNGLERTPDRRSWQRVSEWITGIKTFNRNVEKGISGLVGVNAALQFVTFCKSEHGIGAQEVLTQFTKYKKELEELETHELATINEGTFRFIELEERTDATQGYIKNLEMYIKWLYETKRNEALAHWTTLFETNSYPKTKVAVLTHSPYIFNNLVDFIKAIQL